MEVYRKSVYLALLLVLTIVMVPAAALAQDDFKDQSQNVNNPADPNTFGALPGQTCTSSGGTNCPGPIVDNSATVSTFDVTTCGTIEDANVGVELTHTFVGDLDVTVMSPAGTSVQVFDQDCGSDDDMQAIWDDEGVPNPCPVQGYGNWIPFQALSALDGEAGNGTWTLTVFDNFGGDTGTLLDWSLELTCSGPVPTMNEYWLMALVALLLLSGIALMYRRRRA